VCSSDGEDTGGVVGGELEALAQTCNRRLAVRVAHNHRLVKIDVDAFKDVGMCSVR